MSELALLAAITQRFAPPALKIYPERSERPPQSFDLLTEIAGAEIAARAAPWRARKLARIVPLVDAHADEFRALALEDFAPAVRSVALALRRHPDLPEGEVARAFALIRELSHRVLGKRHFGVQITGAFAMLKGMLAEMATGEGKTLTATLVAGHRRARGLSGPCGHGQRLPGAARRRADGPLYRRAWSHGRLVSTGQSAEERRDAYACDITYCTNKELAFDYLRDRMRSARRQRSRPEAGGAARATPPRAGQLRLRGLHFAIVDEADSVLIDEARTPLIISGQAESDFDAETIAAALDLARQLAPEKTTVFRLEDGGSS